MLLPRLLLSPSNTHAFPGESVLLRCQGDHYTEGYLWLRRGQAVALSGRVQAEADVGLHIHNVTMRDSGSYTCVAVGNGGTAEGSAILNVTGPLLSCEGERMCGCQGCGCQGCRFVVKHAAVIPSQRVMRCAVGENSSSLPSHLHFLQGSLMQTQWTP